MYVMTILCVPYPSEPATFVQRLPNVFQTPMRRLYNGYPTCSGRLEHVGESLYKRRWFTGIRHVVIVIPIHLLLYFTIQGIYTCKVAQFSQFLMKSLKIVCDTEKRKMKFSSVIILYTRNIWVILGFHFYLSQVHHATLL